MPVYRLDEQTGVPAHLIKGRREGKEKKGG